MPSYRRPRVFDPYGESGVEPLADPRRADPRAGYGGQGYGGYGRGSSRGRRRPSGFDLLSNDEQEEAVRYGLADRDETEQVVRRQPLEGRADYMDEMGLKRPAGMLTREERAAKAAKDAAKQANADFTALRGQKTRTTESAAFHAKDLKAFDEGPEGLELAQLQGARQKDEQAAKKTVGFLRGALTPAVAGDPTADAKAAQGRLSAKNERLEALAQKRDRMARQAEESGKLADEARRAYHAVNDDRLGLTNEGLSRAAGAVDIERLKQGLEPVGDLPRITPPPDTDYDPEDWVQRRIKKVNDERAAIGRSDFINPKTMGAYTRETVKRQSDGGLAVDPQAIERAAVLNEREQGVRADSPLSRALELGKLKAGGVTHVGAQPIDEMIERYGGEDAIDSARLVSTYRKAKGRLAEIEEALPGMTERGKTPLMNERDVLAKLLAEKEGDVKARGLWDEVRDPFWFERANAFTVNAAKGAAGVLADAGESIARNAKYIPNLVLPGITALKTDAMRAQDAEGDAKVAEFSDAMRAEAEAWNWYMPEQVKQKLEENFATGDVARGIGSTAAFFGPSVVMSGIGRLAGLGERAIGQLLTTTVATTGAAASGNSFRRQAMEHLRPQLEAGEITRAEFDRSAGLAELAGGVLGSTEAVPFSRFARRVGGVPAGRTFLGKLLEMAGKNGGKGVAAWVKGPGRKMLVDVVSEGIEEGGQEWIQSVGEDLAAGQIFDRERGVDWLAAAKNAAVGGFTGLLFSGVTNAVDAPRVAKRYRELGAAVQRGAKKPDGGGETPGSGVTTGRDGPPPSSPSGLPAEGPVGEVEADDELAAELGRKPAARRPLPAGTQFLYEQAGVNYYQLPDPEAVRGSRTVDEATLAREGYEAPQKPTATQLAQGPAAEPGARPTLIPATKLPVPVATLPKAPVYYRGVPKAGAPDGTDSFYSASRDVAENYAGQRGGADEGIITEHKPTELPQKLYEAVDKESLAEELDIKVPPYDFGFDAAAKAALRAKGYEGIRYTNGTFDADEIHVFGDKPSSQPPAARSDQPRALPSTTPAPVPAAETISQPAKQAPGSPANTDTPQATNSPVGINSAAAAKPKFDKSSTQVTLPPAEAKPFQDFARNIPEDDVYTENGDYGRETEPHITALYGINNDDVDPVRQALASIGPVTVTLGETSAFENKDKPYDVLKVSVNSPALRKVNAAIKKATDNSSDFPGYKPHLTLAYVKKGAAKKYTGDKAFAGKTITFDSLQFRTRDGRSIDIPLAGKAAPAFEGRQPVMDKDTPGGFKIPPPAAAPRTPTTPVSFVKTVAEAAKVKAGSKQHKFLTDFSRRLHRAAPKAFAGIQMVAVSEKEWSENARLSRFAPGSIAAFQPETNTIYLNSGRLNEKNIASAIVHEAGHFAEKYYIGEKFTQKEWEKLTDEQREEAYRAYRIDTQDIDQFPNLKNNRRARAEWVAMQFARVVRGDTQGMSAKLKAGLEKFLADVRALVSKWIGDGSLTTEALDAKILEMLGYAEDVAAEAAPSAAPATEPVPVAPAPVTVASLPAKESVTEEGPKVEPTAATDRKVSRLADRVQLRVQKAFLLDAVKQQIAAAPEELAIDAEGTADLALPLRGDGTPGGINAAKENVQALGKKYGVDVSEKALARGSNKDGYSVEDEIHNKIHLAHAEHVAVEVPGDGTFRIPHTKRHLTAFSERIRKAFGTGISPQTGASRMASTESRPITPLATKVGPEQITEAVRLSQSTDETRYVLNNTVQVGSHTIATDGRRLTIAVGGNGMPVKQADAASKGKYPNYLQVIPKDRVKLTDKTITPIGTPQVTADAADIIKVLDRIEGLKDDKGVQTVILHDIGGKLGISFGRQDIGDYRSDGVPPEHKGFIGVDSDFLRDAMVQARRLGRNEVPVAFGKDDRDILVFWVGKNAVTVIMPVRVEALDAPAEIDFDAQPAEPPAPKPSKPAEAPKPPPAVPPKATETVEQVWWRQYNEQLLKLQRAAKDGGGSGLSDAAEVVRTAEMLGVRKETLAERLAGAGMKPHNVEYALKNYKPQGEVAPPAPVETPAPPAPSPKPERYADLIIRANRIGMNLPANVRAGLRMGNEKLAGNVWKRVIAMEKDAAAKGEASITAKLQEAQKDSPAAPPPPLSGNADSGARSFKSTRADLLAKIDAAIETAPDQDKFTVEAGKQLQRDQADAIERQRKAGNRKPKGLEEAEQNRRMWEYTRDLAVASAKDRYVTIQSGNTKYRVTNTKQVLERLRRGVEKNIGKPTDPTPSESARTQLQVKSGYKDAKTEEEKRFWIDQMSQPTLVELKLDGQYTSMGPGVTLTKEAADAIASGQTNFDVLGTPAEPVALPMLPVHPNIEEYVFAEVDRSLPADEQEAQRDELYAVYKKLAAEYDAKLAEWVEKSPKAFRWEYSFPADPAGTKRLTVVSPDPAEAGKWRASNFDRGFWEPRDEWKAYSHITRDTKLEVVKEAVTARSLRESQATGIYGTPVDTNAILPPTDELSDPEAAQATARTLRQAARVAGGNAGAVSAAQSWAIPSLAEQEDALIEWATAAGLMHDAAAFADVWRRQGSQGGSESQVYFDAASQRVVKRTALGFNSDWHGFFRRIMAHNRLFPDTAYLFHGFTPMDDTQPDGVPAKKIQAVISQPFVEGDLSSDEEIEAALKGRGFEVGVAGISGQYEDERFIVDDVLGDSPNVITDREGAVRFIDPLIAVKPGVLLGTPAEPEPVTKNERVPGQPGYRFRSHPDTLINAGLDAIRQVYRVQGNEATVAAAKAFLDHVKDENAAIEATTDYANTMPAAVRTAVKVLIEQRLNRRRFDPKATPEERAQAKRAFDRLVEIMAERGTALGQEVQAFDLVNRMTPDGVLAAANRSAKQRQEKMIGEAGQKAVEQVSDSMKAENERAIEEATEDMDRALRAVKVSRSIWARYRDSAVARWISSIEHASAAAPAELPPLVEFTNRLTREVQARIDDTLPKGEPRPQRTPAEIIREAVDNREKYAEAWDAAREQLGSKYADRPEILEQLDEAMMGLMDRPYSDKTLDRAIKEAHREMGLKVRDLARMHYRQADALGQTLAEKIAEQAGLKTDDAERLANLVKQRMGKLTAEAKKKALARLIEGKTGGARRVFGAADRIIELSNLGAMTSDEYFKAVAEDLKLPGLTERQAEKLRDLAEKAQSTPEGFQRDRVLTDLLTELQKVKGVGVVDVATAIYYAHILSGYTTQMVNAVSTALNTAADIGVKVGRHPGTAGHALRGIRAGARTGFVQAMSILDTGYAHRSFDEKLPEVSPILEALAKDRDRSAALRGYAKALRYVSRAMKAMDAIFFQSASEAYQHITAARLAAEFEGGRLNWHERSQKVRDLLAMSPAEFERARVAAKAEGLTGLDYQLRVSEIIRQRRAPALVEGGVAFGREATFNQEPRGVLGVAAKAIRDASVKFPPLRLFVPFTNIVSNVANASLNYSPVGITRAVFGYAHESAPQAEERDALLIKGIAGTTGLIWLLAYGLGDDDDDRMPWITGIGPNSTPARNQLRKTGWKPNTVKVGGVYYSYLETPLAIPLAIVGNYIDGLKYNGLGEKAAGERLAKALSSVPETIVSMSFLRGLADFMDAARGRKSWGDIAGNVVAGATTPNLVRQIDRTIDPTFYEGDGVAGTLAGQIPGIRQTFPTRLDVVGQPIQGRPMERFGRPAVDDELWQTLAEKQSWIPEAGKDTKLDRKRLTPEQYRAYVQQSGPAIEARLRANLPRLRLMTPEQADDFVQRVTREERARVKPRLRSVPVFDLR